MNPLRELEEVHDVVPSEADIELPSTSIIENDRLNYDPFILAEHIGPISFNAGEAFGAIDHPHCGLQVILYMIDGTVIHDDSFSSRHPIEVSAGSLLYLRSGSGIVHYEMPPQLADDSETNLECFQFWVNSPKEEKDATPLLHYFQPDEIPIVRSEDNLAEIKVIAGSVYGVSGILEINPQIIFLDITLKKSYTSSINLHIFDDCIETALVYAFSPFKELHKAPIVAVCDKPLSIGQVGVFKDVGTNIKFTILRDLPYCRLLLFGGKRISEQVVAEGPFATCKRAEIETAYIDFKEGKFGSLIGSKERKERNDAAMKRYFERIRKNE
ncbi:hypothetical protein Ciccas_002439 [Cichlidogyrus casuarinus]|uniref:Pirin n=1 Tax=Cichlidogyrus casuarinus TaxID=1844966 RepID=A0ABD2QH78_9PLAT